MKTFAQWASDHGLSESEKGVAEAAWQAALSAQPSPGGQGELVALVSKWRNEASAYDDQQAKETGFDVDWTYDAKARALDRAADELEAALAARQPVGQELRTDLVPGVVRCAKCAFQLHRRTLYLQSGTVGSGDSKTEPCPNGCGPLWPVTWEMWAREGWAEAERLHMEKSDAPPAQAVDLGAVREAVRKAWQKCAAGESVDLQFGTLLALIDSQVKPK